MVMCALPMTSVQALHIHTTTVLSVGDVIQCKKKSGDARLTSSGCNLTAVIIGITCHVQD